MYLYRGSSSACTNVQCNNRVKTIVTSKHRVTWWEWMVQNRSDHEKSYLFAPRYRRPFKIRFADAAGVRLGRKSPEKLFTANRRRPSNETLLFCTYHCITPPHPNQWRDKPKKNVSSMYFYNLSTHLSVNYYFNIDSPKN